MLYEAEDSDYAPDNGAVSLSEGYAVFMDTSCDTTRLGKDGTIIPMAELVYPEEYETAGEDNLASSEIIADIVGTSFVFDVPIGAAKGGYYLSKWDIASSDSYGIYKLRSVDGSNVYKWDISSIYSQENLKFSTSDVRWEIPSFYENGIEYYNYGT